MTKTIIILLLSMKISLLSHAQYIDKTVGIKFEQNLDWKQLKEKAASENKYIFIDCYATWCGPCKTMDNDVYPTEQVGWAINGDYISAKVQMDTTKNDSYSIRKLYTAAREFEELYKIVALPTYLFFSPKGELLHKDIGVKTVSEFIELAQDAKKPAKQLYTLIEKFRTGKLETDAMPDLARRLKYLGDDSLSLEIARIYMLSYLDTLSYYELLTKKNLDFIQANAKMITSKDRIFKLYFEHPKEIDSILSTKDYSESRIIATINREEILKPLADSERNNTPFDWKKTYRTIDSKYGSNYAINTVFLAKINWSYEKKHWKTYGATLMELWEAKKKDFSKYGWMFLNHIAWTICVHSDENEQLNAALTWINVAISMVPEPILSVLDTKANLLYRLGHRQEAITIAKQVVRLSETTFSGKEKETAINYFQGIVEKMTKGERISLVD